MSRLSALRDRTFDVAIVGGGIIGAGIARDAALRGYSVALFEQYDYGSGTTSGSTRLIHGGLRYLEMLDFGLVRMDLREREILLRIAPHLVRPLPFLLPFYERSLFYRLKMRIGLWLYDLLSYDKSLPSRSWLTAEAVRREEPLLEPRGLQGAAMYYDAQASLPERLCLENVLDARAHGAETFNYARVEGALHDGGRVVGLRVHDRLTCLGCGAGSARDADPPTDVATVDVATTNRATIDPVTIGSATIGGQTADHPTVDVRARVVVNASGPWFDRVAGQLTEAPSHRIRTTKGVHFAVPPMTTRAMTLFSPVDERLMFVIPWQGYSWLGTTDTDFTADPADAHATREDMEYIIESVRRFFPAVDASSIVFSNAGVRALVMEEGSESSVSRAHQVRAGDKAIAPGLVSVLGGKLTGYRAIAQEVTDIVSKTLDPQAARKCRTSEEKLPGGRYTAQLMVGTPQDIAARTGTEAAVRPAEGPAGESDIRAQLWRIYGIRREQVIDLANRDLLLRERLAPGCPVIAAQVVFAVREEQCVRLVDFLCRRTDLGFSLDQGRAAAPAAAALMAAELGWDETRRREEMAAYEAEIAETQKFRAAGA
jgi:glycerol-3-phosphate dehydrogenase